MGDPPWHGIGSIEGASTTPQQLELIQMSETRGTNLSFEHQVAPQAAKCLSTGATQAVSCALVSAEAWDTEENAEVTIDKMNPHLLTYWRSDVA